MAVAAAAWGAQLDHLNRQDGRAKDKTMRVRSGRVLFYHQGLAHGIDKFTEVRASGPRERAASAPVALGGGRLTVAPSVSARSVRPVVTLTSKLA